MTQLWRSIGRRLQRKLTGIMPLVAGSVLLAGVLSVMVYALESHLPAAHRDLLRQMRQGQWTASWEQIAATLDSTGITRDALFLLLQIGQVLVAPIPAPLLGLLGGALFGFWQGLLLSILGLTIGSAIAMASSRLLGGTVVRRCVPSTVLAWFDRLAGINSLWSFFLIFLLPAMPDDAVCFLAGLTRLPLHHLLLVCVLGRLPGIAVLTFAGNSLGSDTTIAYLVFGGGMALALVLWLFSEELESFLHTTHQRGSTGA
jgi:uncharacterized membrane protein YdjX (TVP38/TMEM64 family)